MERTLQRHVLAHVDQAAMIELASALIRISDMANIAQVLALTALDVCNRECV